MNKRTPLYGILVLLVALAIVAAWYEYNRGVSVARAGTNYQSNLYASSAPTPTSYQPVGQGLLLAGRAR